MFTKKGESLAKFCAVVGILLALFMVLMIAVTTILIIIRESRTSENSSKPVQNNNEYMQYISDDNKYIDTRVFNILASEENKDLESILNGFARQNNLKISVDYAGTLEIMAKLNEKQKYDAIWVANSIWTHMIDTNSVSLKNSKSTSITPVVFGIKKSKAEELGFVNRTVYTKDLLDAIANGDLNFAMSNPNTTNSGASAYLGMLYTFAGNPEVLTEDILNDVEVKSKMKTFFSGLERTSGTEDFLEELFLNGDYEAVYSYESSIININKKLEAQGREPLYIVYPMDGVPICDNPFIYVDYKDDKKLETFTKIQSYLLSAEGKELLEQKGRRTWYGGISDGVDKSIFNENWGVELNKYLNPVKYPTYEVIKKALVFYQSQYRKPVHVVFCLDYSGSMIYGNGIVDLRNAMDYILSDKAMEENIQFSEEDYIDILAFSSTVDSPVSTKDGTRVDNLLSFVNNKEPFGGTAIYNAAIGALTLLKNEDQNVRNSSIIIMTDGEGNVGKFSDLKKAYNNTGKSIPIYSIMFGEASDTQLEEIAKLSNGKVFDGKKDLVEAFKEVRGYN